jgi:ABC-type antimicrobial peptide transport system permease subunit
MAILERTRELGVVMALGLRPSAVFRMVYFESMFLAGTGLLIGFAISIPIVLYMQGHPISLTGNLEDVYALFGFEPLITFKLKPLNPIGSTLTIFLVAALASLYPALKASRGRPVEALRSV